MKLQESGKRIAVVAGVRTPFAKRRTAFAHLSALDLAKLCTAELVHRSGVAPSDIQQIVFGKVMPSSIPTTNVARDLVVSLSLPAHIEAYSLSQACASGYRAAANIAQTIAAGAIDCGLAGGCDSASDVPVTIPKSLQDALGDVGAGYTLGDRLAALGSVRPRDLNLKTTGQKDPSSVLTLGESAEKMAKENHIDRASQDSFAHRSHTLAARAWSEGKLSDEVMRVHIPPDYDDTLAQDNNIRPESTLESYQLLEPAFDPHHGTVTHGTSAPLCDGASCMLLMHEEKSAALGLSPLGYIRSFAFAGVHPDKQMLIAPAYAIPQALKHAELELSNMDLLDIHEAFSAQVISLVQTVESDEFARSELGRNKRIGTVDWNKLNVNGGSLAMGHPAAATGGRQIMQALFELQRRGGEFALCAASAAGGMGAAMVLEAAR